MGEMNRTVGRRAEARHAGVAEALPLLTSLCAALLLPCCGGGSDDHDDASAPETDSEVSHDSGVSPDAADHPDSSSSSCHGGNPREYYECEPIDDADAGCVGPPPCAVMDSDETTVWPSGCNYWGYMPYEGTYPPCLYTSGCECTVNAICGAWGQSGWVCMM